jgi:micrococcal nuclease
VKNPHGFIRSYLDRLIPEYRIVSLAQCIDESPKECDFTREFGKRYVDLEFEGPLRGNYNRLLSYLILDGDNFNLELAKQGLSPYYTKYGLSKKYDQEFRAAERYARSHKLHIWGDTDLAQKYLRLKSKWGQYRSKTSSSTRIVQTKDWSYVASRKSKVFHRADAKCVKTISPHNLIGFKSREEAIASGRRPCKMCRP